MANERDERPQTPKTAIAAPPKAHETRTPDTKRSYKRRGRGEWSWLLLLVCALYLATVGAIFSGVIGQVLPGVERWLRAKGTLVQHAPPPIRIGVGAGAGALSIALLALTAVAWRKVREPRGPEPPPNPPNSPRLPLIPVRELPVDLFKMGDTRAATFRYSPDPVAVGYNIAVATLNAIAKDDPQAKRGVLIVGESNVGKTRLAYEAARRCLPEWHALVWKHGRAIQDLPLDEMRDANVVVFVDDLHEYVAGYTDGHGGNGALEAAANPETTAVSTLLDLLREPGRARRAVIVATCRSDPYERGVRSSQLGSLFTELEVVQLEPLPSNSANPLVAAVLREFAQRGQIEAEFFDGTVGSLLLRLNEKHNQFLQLGDSPAAWLLRSMKLLYQAGIHQHTERRVAATAADVFGCQSLRNDKSVWRAARDTTVQMGFVTLDLAGNNLALTIRKDVYFDWVIMGTPPEKNDDQDERSTKADPVLIADMRRLSDALFDLQDPEGLFYVGNALDDLTRYEEALVTYYHALALDPTFAATWNNVGNTLFMLERFDDALVAINHALAINPMRASAWNNKSAALISLKRYDEALVACDSALRIDPTRAVIWANKGDALMELNRYDESLLALEHALAIDPTLRILWNAKGNILVNLKRYSEALVAYDCALSLDPNYATALSNKGDALIHLKCYSDALLVLNQALTIQPTLVRAWSSKASTLNRLMRFDEAIVACNRALALDPTRSDAWIVKGLTLHDLERFDEALSAFEHALAVDPTITTAWCAYAIDLITTKRYHEALAASERALALDPAMVIARQLKVKSMQELERGESSSAADQRSEISNGG